jgi:REP element-mobilizing transposase RayT
MPYTPAIHHRRSIRMKGYDYSKAGLYFVTICVAGRGEACPRPNIFGRIIDGEMVLNDFGKIANDEWVKLSGRFPHAFFDIFQIMPNHIHGIIELDTVGATLAVAQNDAVAQNEMNAENDAIDQNDNVADLTIRAGASPAPTAKTTIGEIIGAYKSMVANKCLEIYKSHNELMGKLWQRNYYEHIIRNDISYQRIADYIINNPAKWESDMFYRGKNNNVNKLI